MKLSKYMEREDAYLPMWKGRKTHKKNVRIAHMWGGKMEKGR